MTLPDAHSKFGKVTAKGRCRHFDVQLHGDDCTRLTIKSGSDFMNLYFPAERHDEVMKARIGKKYAFKTCRAIGMKSWSLWFEVACDIPPVEGKTKTAP